MKKPWCARLGITNSIRKKKKRFSPDRKKKNKKAKSKGSLIPRSGGKKKCHLPSWGGKSGRERGKGGGRNGQPRGKSLLTSRGEKKKKVRDNGKEHFPQQRKKGRKTLESRRTRKKERKERGWMGDKKNCTQQRSKKRKKGSCVKHFKKGVISGKKTKREDIYLTTKRGFTPDQRGKGGGFFGKKGKGEIKKKDSREK